ncbi:MAG: YbaN family protein [Sphingorhabdus sp.]
MKRQLYLAAGILSVALGTIGIFLPLLPTVPFMILAAFCFAKSSPALEKRLIEHPRFGPHIVAWREKGAVSRKGKWAATAAFAVSIALGFWMLAMPYSLIPLGVAITCGSWLWTRPEG